MNKKDLKRYCWDTSVFLAWIKGETCHPLADIELVAGEIHSGVAMMIVPATVYEEIMLSRCLKDQLKQVLSFFQRSNVEQAAMAPAIMRKSANIVMSSNKNGLKTGRDDARIVASAIVLNADVLHTLDAGLLRLNGSEFTDGLRIERPRPLSGQRGLV